MKPKMPWSVYVAVVGLGFAALGLLAACSGDDVPDLLGDIVVNPPRQIGATRLVDHLHGEIGVGRFQGNWTFILFGYTHCPDICPATLLQLELVKKAIHEHGDPPPMQVFFVSVDPERDDIDDLGRYATYFDPSFVGVTGNSAALDEFERQVGAFHRHDPKDANGHYAVQHSAQVFLIDPTARLAAKFEPPMKPELVAEQFYALNLRYEESLN